jgi:hypothetical protein
MQTWQPGDYVLNLPAGPGPDVAERVFALVWRFDFTAPGFCVLDAGPGVDSHVLRSWMVNLKERLSAVAVGRGGEPFAFRSLARFDQQEDTKFHLDGAPDRSMLLLGYEASKVQSRLFLGDYVRAAFALGISPQQFLQDYNPMYRRGEQRLAPHVTELPQPADGHARIVLVNNSSLPLAEARTNPLGVMHKAQILNPTEAERRIVNSALLAVGDSEEVAPEQVREFIRTDEISKKLY